ncbi:hypothetical protein KBC79_05550 [Candidatus Woesebacteria bacterium]|nr:hypothetical protein [Candidatus Woesebacteria bacterium]
MNENDLSHIPREMREASFGSFPFSPGMMTGHYTIANLYSFFRRELLSGKTIEQVFGTTDPEPPQLTIPIGHIFLSSTDGVNNSVWRRFLSTTFVEQPDIDPIEQARTLITVNSTSDKKHFEERIAGKKSQFPPSKPSPSLIRAFLFEDKFPIKNNEFFQWLFAQMTWQILEAQANDFNDMWCSSLHGLISFWDTAFPDDPFIPKEM